MREDNGFFIVFFGKDIQKLILYRKNEFGSAYSLEFTQKNIAVQLQIQIKADEPNQDEFHSIIEKVIEKRERKKNVLEFLQE